MMYDVKKIINSLDLFDNIIEVIDGKLILKVKWTYDNYRICDVLNLKKQNPKQKYYEVVL